MLPTGPGFLFWFTDFQKIQKFSRAADRKMWFPRLPPLHMKIDVLVHHTAAKGNVQLHQVPVNRLRLLPLLEYHDSHFVPQLWTEIILQPRPHAANQETVYAQCIIRKERQSLSYTVLMPQNRSFARLLRLRMTGERFLMEDRLAPGDAAVSLRVASPPHRPHAAEQILRSPMAAQDDRWVIFEGRSSCSGRCGNRPCVATG